MNTKQEKRRAIKHLVKKIKIKKRQFKRLCNQGNPRMFQHALDRCMKLAVLIMEIRMLQVDLQIVIATPTPKFTPGSIGPIAIDEKIIDHEYILSWSKIGFPDIKRVPPDKYEFNSGINFKIEFPEIKKPIID